MTSSTLDGLADDITPAARRSAARRLRLLEGPIIPALLSLAAPMVAVLVAQTLVGVAETFYVGFLGTDALAGVALVFPIVMLMTMMSNGGLGGGVASAVARATGAGRRDDADALVRHALVLAVILGIVFTIATLSLGPRLYRALGGRGAVLETALTYSAFVFIGAIPIWVTNLLAAALRGVGNVRMPAIVTLVGAAVLVPLSPLLIFGFGPIPRLGVAGAGIAVATYYVGASIVLVRYLMSGRGGLTLKRGPLQRRMFGAILGVGLISALGTIQANLTVVLVTGAVGLFDTSAIAGYGAASRLDYVLIPFMFGLGTAVVTMVGVNVGAGQQARARKIAWTGAFIAAAAMQAVGLIAASFPDAWLGLFSRDPEVLAVGEVYMHRVPLAYGAVGLGTLLYFAGQGSGRMAVPFLSSVLRLSIAAGVGWFAVAYFDASLSTLFCIVTVASIVFGIVNGVGVMIRPDPR